VIGKRFIAPEPNCGHGGMTFTWIRLARIWMCAKCMASVAALYRRCARCGNYPPENTQLVPVHKAGALCVHCRRNELVQRRFTF
jgi:hypothetical protein